MMYIIFSYQMGYYLDYLLYEFVRRCYVNKCIGVFCDIGGFLGVL